MSGHVETNPGPRRGADDKPGLHDLLYMSYTAEDGRDVHLGLMDQLKPHWRRLAIALKFPQYEIAIMENKNDPMYYLLSEWLRGANQRKDPRPVTWRTLIEALQQANVQEEVAILAKHFIEVPIAPTAGFQHFPQDIAKEKHLYQSLYRLLSIDFVMIILLTVILTSIIMATDMLSFTLKLPVLVVMYTLIFFVKKLLVRGPLTVYKDKLKQIYKAPPPTWDPLPKCGHIKLAMIREKGKRRGIADEEMIKHQLEGAVETIMASKVPIEKAEVFDSGLFDQESQVILVEGPPGGGKTSLAYYYGRKWASGNLRMFDVVAFVRLRDLAVTPASTLPDLLLLACRTTKNTEAITKEMIQQCVDNSPKLLLVLDGWDEAPNDIRKPSFVTNILHSITPQSKILITSRPDSSVILQDLANRVEILGFTEENIHEYFKEALSAELDHNKNVEDECRKLREHFRSYPVIQSCCYIPLNAAILASLFLSKLSLPSTRHELFLKLVLSRINREQQDRHSQQYVCVSSLEDLPHDLRVQLNHLCVLAFEGVKQNRVVFTEEDLVHQNLPHDLPGLGVLQIVDSYIAVGGKTAYRYFIHRSIQELLAAYHISQLGEDEQVKVFEALLNEPRFSAVLQFYAAFTRLTNQGVRNIIIGIDFDFERSSKQKLRLLSFIRCFFEAQIHDDTSLYQQIFSRLSRGIYLPNVTMIPLDCMSIGYFMAMLVRAGGKVPVYLSCCSIDDHSLGLLLDEFSMHAKVCPAGVMQAGVTELDISGNDKITEIGIARVLQTNITNKLKAEHCGMSNLEMESLARALADNSTLEELDISNNEIGENGIGHIATSLQKNSTLKVLHLGTKLYKKFMPVTSLTDTGVLSLARCVATNTSIEHLSIRWYSTDPENTLKMMAESVKNSNLKTVALYVGMCIAEPAVSDIHAQEEWPMNLQERVRKWYHGAQLGGRGLIWSLEDSHLESFELHVPAPSHPEHTHFLQSELAASYVNKARQKKELPNIRISFKFFL